jgi:hypothetical protein
MPRREIPYGSNLDYDPVTGFYISRKPREIGRKYNSRGARSLLISRPDIHPTKEAKEQLVLEKMVETEQNA